MYCRICDNRTDEESEKHLLNCSEIIKNIDIDITNAKYESIFSENIEEQISITKIFDSIFKTRFRLIDEN